MDDSLKQLHTYLEIMLRRKWLIGILLVICTGFAVATAFRINPTYRSTTVILVEKQQIPESYVTPTDRTPFTQRLDTIRQQIMSRQNLEMIAEEFNLYRNAAAPSRIYTVLNNLGIHIKPPAFSKEDRLAMVGKDIEAKIIGDRGSGDAFSISFSGTDPFVTMQVTTRLASFFIEENLKSREEYAEGTSDFLANELAIAKSELESQERAVRAFKEKYMGSLPEQLDANLRTLDRLQSELQTGNVELKTAEDRKLLLQAQLAQMSNADTVASGGAQVNNPRAQELARLQAELSNLLAVYKDTYPDVVFTKQRIRELRGQLSQSEAVGNAAKQPDELLALSPQERSPEIYNNLMVVNSQIQTLRERIATTRKQIKIFERRVEEAPANEQKFADLRRDYDISLANYQALLGKKLSANLAENLEKRQKGERFTVLDPANLPEKPYKPKKLIIALIGVGVGGGLGIGLVLFLEFISPVFRKPEDFEDVVQLKVLTTIPEFSKTPLDGSQKR